MRRFYARAVVFLRWLIVPAWIAGVVAVGMYLPTLEEQAGALSGIVPEGIPAEQAQQVAMREFGFPLQTHVALVQRDPGGLSAAEQRQIVRQARRLSTTPLGPEAVRAAVPVFNGGVLGTDRSRRPTTAITYLFLRPEAVDDALAVGRATARTLEGTNMRLPEPLVTGVAAARIAQAEVVEGRLWILEIATAVLVAFIVGLHFRSLVAPLVTLGAVAVSYLMALRVVAQFGAWTGVEIVEEVRPVMVVLIFGVVTDYSVFFIGRMQQCLRAGDEPRPAARRATADTAGVVTVAALAIVAASSTLLVAEFDFFHGFGPAMAIAVAVAWLVVVTLVPAIMGIVGRYLFWPAPPDADESPEEEVPEKQRRILGFAIRWRWPTALACVALLAAATSGLLTARTFDPTIHGLPADSEPRRALEALDAGFAGGMLSPASVIVRGPQAARSPEALARLEHLIEQRPGVASVLSPSEVPAGGPALLTSRSGNAARLLVVTEGSPLTPDAIETVRELRDRLPDLLDRVGLPAAQGFVGGDTAVISQTIAQVYEDLLWRIGPAVLVVLFVLLALYLRALVAPLFLLAVSVAALLAALGLTAYLFQGPLQAAGIGFFVPVTVFVLLVSLGSDYNIFMVGRIWAEAKAKGLREAIVSGGGKAASSISAAGVVLALSFGLLAIVPTLRFQQVAFAMGVGLLIDAFLVRTLLIPALLSILGRRAGWPGGRLRSDSERVSPSAV